jgi:hypothetical protein
MVTTNASQAKQKTEWLEVENAKLKEETDAVAAAAQAIGKSLRGRVKELEQHSKTSHQVHDERIRDGFFFLAGLLSGIVVCATINAVKSRP